MAADFGGLLARSKKPGAAPAMPAMKGMAETPEEPEVEGTEDPLMERMMPIASDVLEAIRGGDAHSLAEALIAAHKAGAAGPSEPASEMLEE